MTTRLEHNADATRYEIYIDGTLAGYADYNERTVGDTPARDLQHTLTFPEFRGRGVAAQVVEFALRDSRDNGFAIIPTCWYVEKFIAEHREYADLVA
ncbi:GNAT family N-acetyltransferase [Nocardia sp. alder85J]|uniref:GNAT family N-acetyltransferase n=1 Tax=Nocardia sp. alder85J TaxID=2862949 RepID=UPI001CD5306D|nr:GNAT family N-acetyltransferase [Nocardia sp. alder85J]MCX4097295.1 GNAT family N-acetyltransferase [Nocardia sp. alder85J]